MLLATLTVNYFMSLTWLDTAETFDEVKAVQRHPFLTDDVEANDAFYSTPFTHQVMDLGFRLY